MRVGTADRLVTYFNRIYGIEYASIRRVSKGEYSVLIGTPDSDIVEITSATSRSFHMALGHVHSLATEVLS